MKSIMRKFSKKFGKEKGKDGRDPSDKSPSGTSRRDSGEKERSNSDGSVTPVSAAATTNHSHPHPQSTGTPGGGSGGASTATTNANNTSSSISHSSSTSSQRAGSFSSSNTGGATATEKKDKSDGKGTVKKSKTRKGSLDAENESDPDEEQDAHTNGALSKADLLKPIQSFSEASAAQKGPLLTHKLSLCCILFDWSDDGNKDARAKEVKRQQLLELVEYIGKNKNIYTDQVLTDIITMVSTNLFRALPPRVADTGATSGGEDEDDPVFEPSWPHLQIVYEFFLRFIVSSDVDIKVLKKYINGSFVLKILELFDSEDHRERDYLKTILHRIYAKFMSLRAFIRKAINNVFYVFIYDTERHNGIAELLEILGSIINGFALPLKQEHKTFLKKVLTPMHKVKPLSAFHQQLSYCVTQFVDKDPTLAVPVILGLIKYWPVTNSSKEVLFLNELEELLELTQPDEFKILLQTLLKTIASAIGSPHFQVAERALFLWHNEHISNLIADHRSDVLPLIFPVLHVNSQHHWNPTVNNLTLNVLKIFMELDATLVEECSKNYAESQPKKEQQLKQRQEIWSKLTAEAEPTGTAQITITTSNTITIINTNSAANTSPSLTSASSSQPTHHIPSIAASGTTAIEAN